MGFVVILLLLVLPNPSRAQGPQQVSWQGNCQYIVIDGQWHRKGCLVVGGSAGLAQAGYYWYFFNEFENLWYLAVDAGGGNVAWQRLDQYQAALQQQGYAAQVSPPSSTHEDPAITFARMADQAQNPAAEQRYLQMSEMLTNYRRDIMDTILAKPCEYSFNGC